jgi:hypothetical protein
MSDIRFNCPRGAVDFIDSLTKINLVASFSPVPTFWRRWLLGVSVMISLFGLSMVLAPGLIRQGFSLLFYDSPRSIDAFGSGAAAYITLVHAVLGAVMFGWGVMLLMVVIGPFGRGSREGWLMLAISTAAWFIPDTIFSLYSGFWQNAVLNLLIAALIGIPLAATFKPAWKESHD